MKTDAYIKSGIFTAWSKKISKFLGALLLLSVYIFFACSVFQNFWFSPFAELAKYPFCFHLYEKLLGTVWYQNNKIYFFLISPSQAGKCMHGNLLQSLSMHSGVVWTKTLYLFCRIYLIRNHFVGDTNKTLTKRGTNCCRNKHFYDNVAKWTSLQPMQSVQKTLGNLAHPWLLCSWEKTCLTV